MKKRIVTGLVVIVAGAALAALFVWSGLYNVAATKGHNALVRWLLQVGMRQSVETHASEMGPPSSLSEPALFERGIGHFQGGCAPCHGAPGFPPNPIAQQMLPSPPDLSEAVSHWEPHDLFWIVKHGLKYTGMPAWPAPARDDEVWALVAVLVRLPGIGPDEYRRLALVDGMNPTNPQLTTAAGLIEGDPIACARCHGPRGEGSDSGGVPRIAGQKPEYLSMTLADYALDTRPSGIMGPVATYLGDAERRKLAQYYGSLGDDSPSSTRDRRAVPAAEPRLLQLGGAIAAVGIPSLAIPACEACHGPKGGAEDKNPRYPSLAGQHFAYLEQQLKLWRRGVRGGTFDEIMSTVVRNMTDEQIRAVSLYYASAQ